MTFEMKHEREKRLKLRGLKEGEESQQWRPWEYLGLDKCGCCKMHISLVLC